MVYCDPVIRSKNRFDLSCLHAKERILLSHMPNYAPGTVIAPVPWSSHENATLSSTGFSMLTEVT